MDAGLDDHRRVGLRRLLGQTEAVADKVADPVEDLRRHVVVREDHCVAILLQPVDLGDQGGVGPPFDRRDPVAHLLPDRGRLGLDRGSEIEVRRSVSHRFLLAL